MKTGRAQPLYYGSILSLKEKINECFGEYLRLHHPNMANRFHSICDEGINDKEMKLAFKYLEQEGFMKTRFDQFYEEEIRTLFVQVTGDGNCFYRALSKYLYKTEAYYKDLKQILLKKVIENPQIYREM